MRCLLRFLGLACVAILLVSQQGAPDAFAHGGGGGGHGGGGGGHMGGGGFGGGGHFGGGGFGGGHFGGGYSGGHYGGGYSGGHYGGGYSGGSHYGGYSGGHFSTSPGYSGSSIGSHSSGTQHFGNLGGTSSGLSGGTRHFGGSTLNGANLGSHSITGGHNPSFTQHHAFSSHSGSAKTGTHLSAGTGSSHSGNHASGLLNHNGANQAQRGQFLNRHAGAGQTATASRSGAHQLGQMASLGNHHFGGLNGKVGSVHGPGGPGWGGRGFGWNNFHHNFNRGFFNRGFFNGGFFGFGFGYPFFGYGFGLGYYGWPYWFGSGLYGLAYGLGYGLGYGGYGYGGYGGYYYDPYCTAYGYGYGGLGGYNYPGAAVTMVDPLANDLAANQGATNNGKPAGTDVENAKLFAEKGENDFRARDYKAAVYDWKHAALDDPTNGVLVMMLSQAFFATGQFNEAAGAVQHGMQLLPKQDWGVVVKNYKELYGNVQDFTDQLRALEKAVKEKPNDPALRFLAGFQYAYLGYPKEAVDQLDKGLKLAPRDEMAKKLRDEMAAKLPKAVEAPAPSNK